MYPSHWSIATQDRELQQELARRLEIHPVTAQLLINRGIDTTDAADSFLHPKLADLPDPFSFPDMQRAVERIVQAIERRERIAVYGDYDVDGVTATALLVRFLKAFSPSPLFFIPHR